MTGIKKQYKGGAGIVTLHASITNVGLSLQLDGDVSGWPTGAGGAKFTLTVDPLGANERLLCTSLSGSSPATVVVDAAGRGFDGTTGVAHNSGVTVVHGLDADSASDWTDHVYTTTRDDHTQYLRTDGTRAPTGVAGMVGVPVSVGIANSAGAANTLVRSDHVHALGNGAINGPSLFAAAVVPVSALVAELFDLVTQDSTARVTSLRNLAAANSIAGTSNVYADVGPSINVTVPAWATKAIVHTKVRGIVGNDTNPNAKYALRTMLNGVGGQDVPLESDGLVKHTLRADYDDVFTGLTPGGGPYALKIQWKGTNGTSGLLLWAGAPAIDSSVDFDVEFLP